VYNYLNGTLVEKSPTGVTVDVGGIGFHVMVSLSTSQQLPRPGERVKLLVHHLVREDLEQLFGFGTEEERLLFRLLISVSGIGPKLAITVLSGLGLAELKRAIVQGSIPTLIAISGIGRRTAERLIVELREKIVFEGHVEQDKKTGKRKKAEPIVEDSVQALVSLGYSKQNARDAVQKVMSTASDSHLNSETVIRESLKHV
jgi:holliday junction DNA helicase RuvA